MNPSHTLYRIQRIDSQLDSHRRRVREIDAELESDQVLQQARAQRRSLEEALRPHEARATNLNLEMQSVTAQRTQFSNQLYSGAVSNPKELQDIEHKLEELKRRHSDLENALLETMITVEDLQERLHTATEALAQIEAERASQHGALLEERQQLRLEIRRLKAQREKIAAEVDGDTLALYEDLRRKKQGYAVSVLEGDRCQRCAVSQTEVIVQQVRQGNEIVFCSNCGRILIAR